MTILGARPQFIKASAISNAIRSFNDRHPVSHIQDLIVHTGQHFDKDMSDVFFSELNIPPPKYNLQVQGVGHGMMVGQMMQKLEPIVKEEGVDIVLVYGDTNSTLAGSLVASKLGIPLAHVEAGLRSFNMAMPEEVNRIITDRIANELFCPTEVAQKNIAPDFYQHIHLVGDVMYDVCLLHSKNAVQSFDPSKWGLKKHGYALCTLHRAENTNDSKKLLNIFEALENINNDLPIVLPAHPRIQSLLEKQLAKRSFKDLRIIPPQSFLDMTGLVMFASGVLTDSGGLQKEAFFHGVPCVTLRDETEWLETVSCGANYLAGSNVDAILKGWGSRQFSAIGYFPYGDGMASHRIIDILFSKYGNFSDDFK